MAGFLTKAINANPDVKRTVQGPGPFRIFIRWLPVPLRQELSDLRLKFKKKRLVTDHEAIARFMAKHVIVGWEKLTKDVFVHALKIHILSEHQDEIDRVFADNDGCYPYSFDDAIALYLNAVPAKFSDLILEDIDAYDEEEGETRDREDRKSA